MTDRITDEELDNLLIAAAEMAQALQGAIYGDTDWHKKAVIALAGYELVERESDD